MNHEDVELELSSGEPTAEARAHLEACEPCRQTATLLGLAALPPLADSERLLLNGLAASAQREWRLTRQPKRSGRVVQLGRLALAAGVGALIASGTIFGLRTTPAPVTRTETVYVTPPELAVMEIADEFTLSDDEVFFDVGWPSPTEGDL